MHEAGADSCFGRDRELPWNNLPSPGPTIRRGSRITVQFARDASLAFRGGPRRSEVRVKAESVADNGESEAQMKSGSAARASCASRNCCAASRRNAAAAHGDLEIQKSPMTAAWRKPGTLFVAIHGEKTDGNKFVSDAVAAGRSPLPASRRTPARFRRNFRGSSCGCAQGAGHHRGKLFRAPRRSPEADWRDRDERQDHDVLSGGFDSARRGMRSWPAGHDRPSAGARDAAAPTPRRNRSICRSFWPMWFGREARTRYSKPVRTRWRWTACGDARLRWRFSRISRAIISIITRRSRNISRPSAACLKARAPRRRLWALSIATMNMEEACGPASRTLTYGLEPGADVTTRKPALSLSGLECTAETPAGKSRFARSWWGEPTSTTFLPPSAPAWRWTFPPEVIAAGIAQLSAVPGRFERIDAGQPFLVVVDYAHTDDALRNLLATAKELNPDGPHHYIVWLRRGPRPHQAPA
jgi:hypothetical protein